MFFPDQQDPLVLATAATLAGLGLIFPAEQLWPRFFISSDEACVYGHTDHSYFLWLASPNNCLLAQTRYIPAPAVFLSQAGKHYGWQQAYVGLDSACLTDTLLT